jgi:hypothetical protein
MKLFRLLLAVILVGLFGGLGYVAQQAEPAGSKMTSAAQRFLAALTAAQKTKATFAFDDRERTNWHFVPLQDQNRQPTRKGLPLADMTPEQKQAAFELVRAGTSPSGNQKAITIMSLENILQELEQGGAVVRHPEWYFFAVFGTPAATGTWGWRVEGHHLALNFVVTNGRVTSSTPAFFGANPATVKDGPRKNLRTLPEAEDLAIDLFKSLDANQRKVAYRAQNFPEITQGNADSGVGAPTGLRADQMTDKQRQLLKKLLQTYADRMPDDIARVELGLVQSGGFDEVRFAYAGGMEPGQPHSYRIQGPAFVVEFLNVQGDSAKHPANHIHSVWRHLKDDFGVKG